MNFDDYKNEFIYPERPKKPIAPDTKNLTVDNIDIMIKAFQCFIESLFSYKKEVIKYKEEKKKWDDEEGRLYEKFKTDLFKEFGIENNPKREMLFEKAWSDGHSAGYFEVYNYMYDLVDLIR